MTTSTERRPRMYVTHAQFAELRERMLRDAVGVQPLTPDEARGLIARGMLAGKVRDVPFHLVGTPACPPIEVIIEAGAPASPTEGLAPDVGWCR